ncbi:MAG: DsbA family protein [Deltaproteobacteria bacterium]|nr:DsbA family protein [Deltaproteobacteria bacterium]
MKHMIVMVMAVTFSMAVTAWADEAMTKAQGDAILKELKAIKNLLEKQQKNVPAQPKKPEPEVVDVKVGVEGPTLGRKDAPLTLVEFTDYECPYCKRFYDSTFAQLKKNYIDTGKLKFVSRNLPLPFHKNAKKAAQATSCAGDQGKYWEMRDVVFKNSRALGENNLSVYAENLKLDMKKFNACLDSDRHLDKIDADVKAARSASITGTPSFVLGKSVKKGQMKGEKVVGARPYSDFEAKIKAILAGGK